MSLNVLVVDDSAVMRSMIIRAMKMAELPLGEIHQAGDGQDGLDQLKANWIDLVVVDINMPVMNGEEMIGHMKTDPLTQDTPIIVVSTEGSEKRIQRLKDQGAMFIHKPFSPEQIRDTIIELTGIEG
jgi:two-component system chemotaxis response regulator CheY